VHPAAAWLPGEQRVGPTPEAGLAHAPGPGASHVWHAQQVRDTAEPPQGLQAWHHPRHPPGARWAGGAREGWRYATLASWHAHAPRDARMSMLGPSLARRSCSRGACLRGRCPRRSGARGRRHRRHRERPRYTPRCPRHSPPRGNGVTRHAVRSGRRPPGLPLDTRHGCSHEPFPAYQPPWVRPQAHWCVRQGGWLRVHRERSGAPGMPPLASSARAAAWAGSMDLRDSMRRASDGVPETAVCEASDATVLGGVSRSVGPLVEGPLRSWQGRPQG